MLNKFIFKGVNNKATRTKKRDVISFGTILGMTFLCFFERIRSKSIALVFQMKKQYAWTHQIQTKSNEKQI